MAGVLQHLRSSTLDKRPNPASMVDGQVAINYASGAPGMFFKDSNGSLVKVGPVHVGSGAPNAVPASGGTAGNSIGEQWLDNSGGTYVFKIWDGVAWRSETGEFVNATGDTMTGDLVMNNANLVFEGSVDDGFETTLTVVNPTADRTITLPNVTGTVVTTGDSGTVTSTMIADGTIVNADVNASAAIAGTKISPNFGSQTVQTTGIVSHALGSASAPTVTFTGDTNTGLYSPGADQVAISTNGTGRLFVDSSGRLLVGTSTARSVGGLTNQVQIEGVNAGTYSQSWVRNIAGTGGPSLFLGKSRSGSVGGVTIVNVNDNLGGIYFCGANGVDLNTPGAAIESYVDGTPGASDMPGRIVFSTTADGSASLTERMRITSDGKLGLGTSSPSRPLTVDGIIQSESSTLAGGLFYGAYTGTTAGNQLGVLDFYGNGTGVTGEVKIIGILDAGSTTSAYLSFNTTSSGTLTEKVRITSDGKVGIGTNPASLLDISGSAPIFWMRDTSAYGDGEGPALYFNALDSGSVDRNVARIVAGASGSNSGILSFHTRVSGTTAERARITSSGQLLVGTSTARSNFYYSTIARTPGLQYESTGSNTSLSVLRTDGLAALFLANAGTVIADDSIGGLNFVGNDGTNLRSFAKIEAAADGAVSAGDVPGRLEFSTTAAGASSPTERFRITNDGVIAHDQLAPAAVNATATLTVANLKTGIITSTSAAATDMTLPTGTNTEAGFSGIYTNMTFEWSVINTGPSLVRVLASTAHTIVGSGSVATGTSGRFASRRTAANTFVTYRLS